MKLYTEQDVLKMLRSFHNLEMNVQLCMLKLTPIELPTDEEIEILRKKYQEDFGTGTGLGFEYGAKWMRDKIKQEDKTFKQKSKWTKL